MPHRGHPEPCSGHAALRRHRWSSGTGVDGGPGRGARAALLRRREMLIVRADVLDDFAEVSRAGDYFRTMELGIVEISPAAPIRSSTTISLASRSGGQPHVHS